MIRWAVVQTKPNAEYRAMAALRDNSYAVWTPEYVAKEVQTRRGRPSRNMPVPMKQIHRPLFPTYVFVPMLDGTPWWPIKYLPGILGVLTGLDDKGDPYPCTIPHEVVKSLQERSKADGGAIRLDGAIATRKRFKLGEAVKIKGGPAGALSGLVQQDAGARVRILLYILGGERLIWLSPDSIEVVA